MTKLISAILSLTMLFGTGAAPASAAEVTANVPVMVGKQQAVYEKYELLSTLETRYRISWKYKTKVGGAIGGGRTGYYINPITGLVDVGGEMYEGSYSASEWFPNMYAINRTDNYLIKYTSENDGNKYIGYRYYGYPEAYQSMEQSKGSYLADVTTVSGSLPTDGKHSDGFWYVFKNLVED